MRLVVWIYLQTSACLYNAFHFFIWHSISGNLSHHLCIYHLLIICHLSSLYWSILLIYFSNTYQYFICHMYVYVCHINVNYCYSSENPIWKCFINLLFTPTSTIGLYHSCPSNAVYEIDTLVFIICKDTNIYKIAPIIGLLQAK